MPTIPATINLNCYNQVVVVPAYNEACHIESVLLKLKQHPVTIVVVDDGSTDDTSIIAQAMGAVVIPLLKNQGKGAALNAGFIKARQMDPDVIVVIDGDGQHLPEELPQLVAPILLRQGDIVIGSRYLRDSTSTPLMRRWGHKFINLVTGLFSGIYVTDSQSGFRAFSRRAYKNMNFHSDGFSVESEMQFIARELQLKIYEVPITIRYTEREKRSTLEQGLNVLNGIFHLMIWYRPTIFFGFLGIALIVAGILWGSALSDLFLQAGLLASSNDIVGMLLIVAGLVSFSTGITLHSKRDLLLKLLQMKSNRISDE